MSTAETPRISSEEIKRRKAAMENAKANSALEGLSPSQETLFILEQHALGKITDKDILDLVKTRAKRLQESNS